MSDIIFPCKDEDRNLLSWDVPHYVSLMKHIVHNVREALELCSNHLWPHWGSAGLLNVTLYCRRLSTMMYRF